MYAGRLSVLGHQRLYKPMHPYTRVCSTPPSLDSEPGGRLAVIQGLMPDPTTSPKAAAFTPVSLCKGRLLRKPCGMVGEPNHGLLLSLGINGEATITKHYDGQPRGDPGAEKTL